MTFTHYSATINLPGHTFPLFGVIDVRNMLLLANNGRTPSEERAAELAGEAARIRSELEAGRVVATRSATIQPITAEEYERAH